MHQSELLMLDHGCMSLCYFLVVLQVYKLFESPQILVQLPLDLGLSSRELQLIFVSHIGQTEVSFNLVYGLLDKCTSLFAHNIKEEEFQMAFIS